MLRVCKGGGPGSSSQGPLCNSHHRSRNTTLSAWLRVVRRVLVNPLAHGHKDTSPGAFYPNVY